MKIIDIDTLLVLNTNQAFEVGEQGIKHIKLDVANRLYFVEQHTYTGVGTMVRETIFPVEICVGERVRTDGKT